MEILHHIDSTEYLNYESGKFSKSLKQGVFGDDAMNSGLDADLYRYYLLAIRPEKSDTVFSWRDFQEKVNKELVANLGNLINRTMTFIDRYYDKNLTTVELNDSDKKFWEEIKASENLIRDFSSI